jgi:hypothetical protein
MKKLGSAIEILFYYIIPLVFIASYLYTGVQEIQYGLNRDYAEGTTLTFVEKWRASESPRALYSAENFAQGNITGYPFAHLGAISILSHDPGSALSIGRILSIVSALVLSILAWLILSNFGLAKIRHLPLLMTLVLYQTAVFDWSLLARADLLAAMLEILGILFYVRVLRKNGTSLLPSLLCFLLAFFCKQNFIAGPLLVFAFEFARAPRQIVKAAPLYILAVATALGVVTWIFGISYWEHTITQLGGQVWYLSRFAQMLSSYVASHLYIFILAIAALLILPLEKQGRNFLAAWFIIGFALALFGLGRSGSNFNYFIPLSAPLAVLCFLSIHELLQSEITGKSLAAISVVLVFIGFSYTENHNLAGRLTYLDHRSWPPTRPDAEAAKNHTQSHLESFAAKNVFCDEPGICILLGYIPKFTYFENNMNTQMTNQKSLEQYDTLLLTEYPSENLAWTKFKLPEGFVKMIHEKYELRRISDLGFIFTKKAL